MSSIPCKFLIKSQNYVISCIYVYDTLLRIIALCNEIQVSTGERVQSLMVLSDGSNGYFLGEIPTTFVEVHLEVSYISDQYQKHDQTLKSLTGPSKEMKLPCINCLS